MCQPTPLVMRHAGARSYLRDNPPMGAPELLGLLVILAVFIGLPVLLVVKVISRHRD